MKQAAATPTTKSRHDDDTATVITVLARTFLDTTWRIATPVILFTVLGIVGDRHFGTKPWLTLLSVIIGFVFAVLLIKRQLAAVERLEDRK